MNPQNNSDITVLGDSELGSIAKVAIFKYIIGDENQEKALE